MIGKVVRGNDIGGLLRYLFGPGRANEHTNPHIVAAWDDGVFAAHQRKRPAAQAPHDPPGTAAGRARQPTLARGVALPTAHGPGRSRADRRGVG